MISIPLPDDGKETDAVTASLELPAAVRTRALALLHAIKASVADARALGPTEPVTATMHVCRHSSDPNDPGMPCGPITEIRGPSTEIR